MQRMTAPDFPILPLLPEIRAALAANPRLVLEAPPGAGKTTQVPLALLDQAWLAGRKTLLLEPRRNAARPWDRRSVIASASSHACPMRLASKWSPKAS